MSKLTQKENALRKAQARLDSIQNPPRWKVVSHLKSREFQIDFQREDVGNGKFKTKANIIRGKKEFHGGKGILHNAANLKYRVKGDKPSVTRAINSANPQTFSGKLFKKTAQAVNFAAHDVSQTTVDVALATETIGLESAKNAQREVQNKLKQKYTREAVDDYHKGTIFTLRTSADAVKGTRKHFKQKKQHKLEKAKFKLQKAENRLVKEQNKPKFKANKSDLKSAKSEFKKHKKNFKNGSRSNVLKARQMRRKQAFQQTKKEIQFKQKEIKKDEKFRSKKLVNQRNISAFTAENLLALKPVDYGGKKMKASAWQKAVNEDSDNDFMHAVDSAKRRIAEPIGKKFNRSEILQRQQKKRDKLSDKESKSKSKNRLRQQENRLQNKKEKPKKKKKSSKNKSFAERFRDSLKKSVQFVKNIYEKEVKSFFASIAVPILIMLLVFAFIIMIFSSILSGGGFTLGTYAAQDYDLSEAEKYYTKLAYDMNEQILKVSDTDKWKKGLVYFGAKKKNLKDDPDTWYWGRSDVYDWDPVYDFDCYKLWSFLCAYYYDFDSDDNGDIKYWKFGKDTKALLDEIFETEYEFVYWYDNTSRWEELDNYNYFGGGSAESGTYYRCETTAYIYENQPYKYRFKPQAITSELSQYEDSEGYICINENYRVLNPNDDYSLTGYMIMDNRYYSGTSKPFYYRDSSSGKFYFLQNGERNYRSFWGWDGVDAWFMVSPTDTQIWNCDITDSCMYGYYEKYVWKTDCRLYYNVKQKKTFDEVIEDKLKSMSHKTERWEYYQLLVGNEDGNEMYGNHQTIQNLLSGNSIRDYTLKQEFGYEITGWNQSSSGLYQGIKVYATSGSALYAPFDCTITDVDTTNRKITISKDDVVYWYDGSGGTKRDTEITIANAKLISGLAKGDTLKAGEKFAKTTAGNVNFHIYIDTDGYGWDYIDPRLVLY